MAADRIRAGDQKPSREPPPSLSVLPSLGGNADLVTSSASFWREVGKTGASQVPLLIAIT